jgi:CheY-like chemotaxis protein
VRVLRHELAQEADLELLAMPEAPQMSHHRLRNRLNKATIGLALVQKQLELGRSSDADATLERVLAEFQSLEDDLSAVSSAGERGERRALLVEDDANERELLAGFLQLSGFQVHRVADGCDALDYLAEHEQPDVVLLDMQMPRCDGPTTIHRIRQNPAYAGLRVFAVSGKIPADMGVSVGPAGVDRWFRKPLNPQALVQEIQRDLQLAAG